MRLVSFRPLALILVLSLPLPAAAAPFDMTPDNTPPAADPGAKSDRTDPPAAHKLAPEIPPLDELFRRLKSAKDDDRAKLLAALIEARWLESGSDTVDLLMMRVHQAMNANDAALALDLLDAVVALKPDYAEGWNKRAAVHWAKKDIGRALNDVEATLRLEPRHYGAMIGLATILKEIGQDKRALETYRRLLEVYPRFPDAAAAVKELSLSVEGHDT